MRQRILIYLAVITIPIFLAINAWQSHRYTALSREISRLEEAQGEWVESNKRLLAGITVLSSPARIERIARTELELRKIKPENVLQINVRGDPGRDL